MARGFANVGVDKLRLSKAPVAELAAASLKAERARRELELGEDRGDFVLISVPAGEGPATEELVKGLLDDAPAS